MKILARISCLGFGLVSTLAMATVSLQSNVIAPSLPGMVWTANIPAEPDFNEQMRKISFSIPADNLQTALSQAGLPSIERHETTDTGAIKDSILEKVCFDVTCRFGLQRNVRTGAYEGEADLYDLFRDLYNGGADQITPAASYAVYYNGKPGFPTTLNGNPIPNARTVIGSIKNHPYSLTLPVSEITKVESQENDALKWPDTGETYERLRRYCGYAPNHAEGFMAFLCDNMESPAFTTQLRLRTQFVDQDGTPRDFVFQFQPAIYKCNFWFGDHPECSDVGDTAESWQHWLGADTFDTARAIAAGTEAKTKSLVFDRVIESIHKVDEKLPPLGVVNPNANTLRVKEQ